MLLQRAAKGRWRPLVKDYFHERWLVRSSHQTVFSVAKHQFDLLASDTGKPFKKIVDASATFQVLK